MNHPKAYSFSNTASQQVCVQFAPRYPSHLTNNYHATWIHDELYIELYDWEKYIYENMKEYMNSLKDEEKEKAHFEV